MMTLVDDLLKQIGKKLVATETYNDNLVILVFDDETFTVLWGYEKFESVRIEPWTKFELGEIFDEVLVELKIMTQAELDKMREERRKASEQNTLDWEVRQYKDARSRLINRGLIKGNRDEIL